MINPIFLIVIIAIGGIYTDDKNYNEALKIDSLALKKF
jgi:hypothetical protein